MPQNNPLHATDSGTSSSARNHASPVEVSVCWYAHCVTLFEAVSSATMPPALL